jgi:hypothetical protein
MVALHSDFDLRRFLPTLRTRKCVQTIPLARVERVYDDAGTVIGTPKRAGDFKEP